MSESKEVQNRKRKLDKENSEEKEDVKRILISQQKSVELLDLADELLMEIAMKLDGESLHNVSL